MEYVGTTIEKTFIIGIKEEEGKNENTHKVSQVSSIAKRSRNVANKSFIRE